VPLHIQADRDLARRSISGSLLPFFLFVTLGVFTPYFRDYSVLATTFATSLALLGVVRRNWALAFEQQSMNRPARWRFWFGAGALASAVCWSAFATTTIVLYGSQWTTWFVLLLTAGICAGATSSFAPRAALLDPYLLLLLFPTGFASAVQGTDEGRAFAVAILLFLVFLERQGKTLSKQYWKALADSDMVSQQRLELLRRSEFLNALIENSPLAIVALSESCSVQLCNPAFERMFQFSQAELIGKDLDELFASTGKGAEAAELTARVRAGETIHSTGKRRKKDGSYLEVQIHAVPLVLAGQRIGLYAMYEDITERKRAEAEVLATREILRDLALRDPLTGVWNRRGILDILDKEMSRVRRTNSALTVLMVDLDHFKEINDTFGHRAGDEVLMEAAKRWSATLRGSDSLGRYGGEEFLVLAPECDTVGATHMAQRICHAISAFAVRTTACEISVTASVGVAVVAMPQSASELLHLADGALYHAKASGRNCFEVVAQTAEARPNSR